MDNSERISLYYSEGASDKEYHASLEPKGKGFVVNFSYGRRGSTLTTGTKTATPISYEKAKATYDKLIKEKLAKGYAPGDDGTAYQHTDQDQRQTDILPQLLNEVSESRLEELILDNGWWMQEKFDGKRVLIRSDETGIVGINRRGLTVGLPLPIIGAAAKLPRKYVLDGECVGETFFAFDMLVADGEDIRILSYDDRYARLALSVVLCDSIKLAEIATLPSEKRSFLARMRAEKREGVVLKYHAAPYKAGRPNSGGTQLKFKFTSSASCIVLKQNGSKRSVALGVLDGSEVIAVGNVTIPVNFTIPKAGKLVEVRYLYAYKGGSLYQPVYLGERDDIERGACSITQLKYKGNTSDEEDE